VNLPGRFVKLNHELLTLPTKGVVLGTFCGVPTSIDNMNPNNVFIRNLAGIPIAPGVAAHSIIAVDDDEPLDEAGDGVVKYTSAQIEGVESEKDRPLRALGARESGSDPRNQADSHRKRQVTQNRASARWFTIGP
jgi:hypothetical protein